MSALFKALAVVALSFLAGMGGDASLPTAAFSVSASSPSVNTPVQFQDGYAGEEASWLWDFGDGPLWVGW